MGCCVTKSTQHHSPHQPPLIVRENTEIVNIPRLSSLRHTNSDISTFLICPYCLEEFRETTRLENFTDHLIFCIRNGPISNKKNTITHLTKDSPYNTKTMWLREQCNKIRVPWHSESMKLIIRRDNFLESSMRYILTYTNQDLHKEFQITFEGEQGMDAGGVLRE